MQVGSSWTGVYYHLLCVLCVSQRPLRRTVHLTQRYAEDRRENRLICNLPYYKGFARIGARYLGNFLTFDRKLRKTFA